jgi:hypothetical protein
MVVGHLGHSWALNVIICWIQSDGQARLSLKQNRGHILTRNPSAHFHPLGSFSLRRARLSEPVSDCAASEVADPEVKEGGTTVSH